MKDKMSELESMGISEKNIENMDESELREVIERLGLDPEDYEV